MQTVFNEALAEPDRPVRRGFQLLLAVANAGASCSLLPVVTVLIPIQATQIAPTNQASSLAWVLALGAFGALVGNPLAGALSDRTTSRFGRRRPWLLVGMLGTAVGLLLLANSPSIALLAVAWMMTQFFGNTLLSGFGAVVPDRVPVRQRGTTLALIGLVSPVAIVLTDVLLARVHDLRVAYGLLIAFQALMTLLFVALYRETPLAPAARPPFSLRAFLSGFWLNPRRNPRFAMAWGMWFMMWLGYTLGTGGFFFLFVQNIVGFERIYPGHAIKEGMALLQMLQILIGVPLMLAAGVLSDRMQNRRLFVRLGALVILIGLFGLLFFRSWPLVVIASVTIGAGFWIFYSLGLAMITQLLPSASNRGKDLGVINIAATLPQIIMPPIGAAILNRLGESNVTGYTLLFGLGCAALLAALAILRRMDTA